MIVLQLFEVARSSNSTFSWNSSDVDNVQVPKSRTNSPWHVSKSYWEINKQHLFVLLQQSQFATFRSTFDMKSLIEHTESTMQQNGISKSFFCYNTYQKLKTINFNFPIILFLPSPTSPLPYTARKHTSFEQNRCCHCSTTTAATTDFRCLRNLCLQHWKWELNHHFVAAQSISDFSSL